MNIPGWFCFGQIGADKENNVPPKPKESFYKNYKFPWIVKRSYQLRLEEESDDLFHWVSYGEVCSDHFCGSTKRRVDEGKK